MNRRNKEALVKTTSAVQRTHSGRRWQGWEESPLSDAGLATAKQNQSDILLLRNQEPSLPFLHCCRSCMNNWLFWTSHSSGRSHLSPYDKTAEPRWDKKGCSLKIWLRPLSFPLYSLHKVRGKLQGFKLPQKWQEGKHFQQSFAQSQINHSDT